MPELPLPHVHWQIVRRHVTGDNIAEHDYIYTTGAITTTTGAEPTGWPRHNLTTSDALILRERLKRILVEYYALRDGVEDDSFVLTSPDRHNRTIRQTPQELYDEIQAVANYLVCDHLLSTGEIYRQLPTFDRAIVFNAERIENVQEHAHDRRLELRNQIQDVDRALTNLTKAHGHTVRKVDELRGDSHYATTVWYHPPAPPLTRPQRLIRWFFPNEANRERRPDPEFIAVIRGRRDTAAAIISLQPHITARVKQQGGYLQYAESDLYELIDDMRYGDSF